MNRLGRLRWPTWIALLAGAAWLALFGDRTPVGVAVPMGTAAQRSIPLPVPRRETSTALTATPVEPLETLVPRDQLIASTPHPERDLFVTTNWNPPPAPVQPPPAPPAPNLTAPPFTVVGKKLEAGQWEVYLMRGDQTFIAREGSTIDGIYRVEKITPPNLTMTSIAEGQGMTLLVGDAQ